MNLIKWLSILLLCNMLCSCGKTQQPANPDMEWWREARFGMFVHWGLYSVAAGEWKGKQIDGIGEWIQNFAKIPRKNGSNWPRMQGRATSFSRPNTTRAFACI